MSIWLSRIASSMNFQRRFLILLLWANKTRHKYLKNDSPTLHNFAATLGSSTNLNPNPSPGPFTVPIMITFRLLIFPLQREGIQLWIDIFFGASLSARFFFFASAVHGSILLLKKFIWYFDRRAYKGFEGQELRLFHPLNGAKKAFLRSTTFYWFKEAKRPAVNS